MAEFTSHHTDRSDRNGFQFDFYCKRCRHTWRSEYQTYTARAAKDVLGAAGALLGGLVRQAANVANYGGDSGYRQARDKAFLAAVEVAKTKFLRCTKCAGYVCEACFDRPASLCTDCAATVAKASAPPAGMVACPACKKHVAKAKFCAECGGTLVPKCGQCQAELAPAAKFCPECGAKR